MYENNFIDQSQFEKELKDLVKLRKEKSSCLMRANSYSEEVRRRIKEKYGFKQLYSEGLAIKIPLDVNYQVSAKQALRKGIEEYDRRHSGRPIVIKYSNKNWEEKLKNLKIITTSNEIDVNDDKLIFKSTKQPIKIKLRTRKISWAIKKDVYKSFKNGDFIFVKKQNNNSWTLKQYPKVNGGIVVLDPFQWKS